ncbi:MAG: hypothetical protein J6J21_00095, partial [Clostridia bacterium]|nr:hypothetical protein [Clostridia bacterium]
MGAFSVDVVFRFFSLSLFFGSFFSRESTAVFSPDTSKRARRLGAFSVDVVFRFFLPSLFFGSFFSRES